MLAICWKGYSKSYQNVARNVGENVGRKCCSICARLNRCIGWKRYVKIFLLSVKMNCLRCFCCAMKFLMTSVTQLGCKRCICWKRYKKAFLPSVKISCLRCFCCAVSASEFFLRCRWKIWVVRVVFNKSVDFFGSVMNLEKLIMDKENQNKTNTREGVCNLFYQHYYDLLRQRKVVKVGLENIITSYYQITEVSVFSIRQHAGSKDDRKQR